MAPTRRFRIIPLLFATAMTLTLGTAMPGQGLSSAVAGTIVLPVTVLAGRDYATTTFNDAWDYGNTEDLVLDAGPALGVSGLSMSGGMVNFTTHSGYVSPIWGGYSNEVPVEREGTRAGNALDARIYARLNLHINVSARTGVELSWYTCGALRSDCRGMMNFVLMEPGWHDVDLNIKSLVGQAWTGQIVGLRLAFGVPVSSRNPTGRAWVHLDSLRIYQPLSGSAIGWAAPGTSEATLWWTDSATTINAVASQHAGPVANAPKSANSSARVNANVSGYSPATRFWSVDANGTKTLVGMTPATPRPVIDSPSAAGCGDYATKFLGRPWTFPSVNSLAARANIGALSFTPAGVLSATNAGPQRNDPSITLPLYRGSIDGRLYHRLTIVESYDGPFNLENRPGGGAMARVLWQSPGQRLLAQSAPLVTFTGKRSITVDMAMPALRLTDPEGPLSQRYPFASASITRLRYDPNEDPGARRWHLYSIRLATDCQAPWTFLITWHDTWYTPGSTALLQARSSTGVLYPLGSATERAGLNSYVVRLNSLPRGAYTVVITVTNSAHVTTTAVSAGPLVRL